MLVKKRLESYIKRDNPLFEFFQELNDTHGSRGETLYEQRQNTEWVINPVVDKLLRTGRIKLNGYKLETPDDIVVISKLLSNKAFETGRMLYLKNGVIVGQDATTIDSSTRTQPYVHKNGADRKDEFDDYIADTLKKARRVGADEIYHLHNHPAGDADPSPADKQSCATLTKEVGTDLFKGEIVIGDDNFTIMQYNPDTGELVQNVYGKYEGKDSPYPQMKDRDDVIDFIRGEIAYESGYTYVIFTDARGYIDGVLQIKNIEFNDQNIFNYIRNEKQRIAAAVAFLCTESESIFLRSIEYVGEKADDVFDDSFFKEKSKSSYYSAGMDPKIGPTLMFKNLFLPDPGPKKIQKL